MKNLNFLRSWFSAAALGAALSSYAGGTSPNGVPVHVWLTGAKGLASEIRSNPNALDRYERHFGMDEASVLTLMDGLHPGALVRGGEYVVYEAGADGVEAPRTETLKKGERVFLDASDKPVLLADGGAPIEAVAPLTASSSVGGAAAAAPLAASPATSTDAATNPEEPLVATEPDAPVSMAPASAVPQTMTATPAARKNYSWLWTTLIPPAFIFLNGGGHGGNGSPEPVPEPASLAVLALGGVGLMRRKKA